MNTLLIKYFGIIYIIAAIHRFILKDQRLIERDITLKLPVHFDLLIIIFELIAGILLLSNNDYQFKIKVLKFLFLFIFFGCIIAFINNYDKILSSYHELWTLKPTALSFSYHLIYLIMLYSIINNNNNKI